jgi:hypothetical protein
MNPLLEQTLVFIFMLVVSIVVRYFRSPGRGVIAVISSFAVKSLSIKEIVLLARTQADRSGFIKDYYDFKHKNILSLIKGVSAIIVLNLGVIIKGGLENPPNESPYTMQLISITGLLSLINILYFLRLNKCIKEFSTAIKLYSLLK